MAQVRMRMAQPGLVPPHQQRTPMMVSMTQPPPVSMQGEFSYTVQQKKPKNSCSQFSMQDQNFGLLLLLWYCSFENHLKFTCIDIDLKIFSN